LEDGDDYKVHVVQIEPIAKLAFVSEIARCWSGTCQTGGCVAASYADERLAGCSPQLEIGAEMEFCNGFFIKKVFMIEIAEIDS
jgi:hypothetical protein